MNFRTLAVVFGLFPIFAASGCMDSERAFRKNAKAKRSASGRSQGSGSTATATSVRFDRGEFFRAMLELHSYYSSAAGLQRPNGLSLGGKPDFEGIAAWIFDVYLTARAAGADHGEAFANSVAWITQSEEWRSRHPGESPLEPRTYPSSISLDRGEFMRTMQRLDDFYKAEEGLQRPDGLSLGGEPDFEGIAAWIFDVYLNARLSGQSAESAWQSVVFAIQASDEWRSKHPDGGVPGGAGAAERRAGIVRLHGGGVADDHGPFNPLGASLFWGAWGYRHDRAKLERNLQFLSENGFHYVRVLGVVGCPGPGAGACGSDRRDPWDGRESDWRWHDYDQVIAGLTDLAYDTYGLRVEWTLIGDGQLNIPSRDDRFHLVDRFLAMSRGREHKIMHFEIANEHWQNGFAEAEGRAQLRDLTRYMNERTDILVAASDPGATWPCEETREIYSGGVADIGTIHLDRWYNEDGWRPVRQPWEYPGHYSGECGMPAVGSQNEPIGPGSSVAKESDPVKLVASWVVGTIAKMPFYVFHAEAGIWGGTIMDEDGKSDLYQVPQATYFKNVKKYLPGDIASWSRQNHHWSGHPFVIYGDGIPNHMVPDGASEGVNRGFAATRGDEFLVILTGIQGSPELQAKRAMMFDIIHPATGETLDRRMVGAGERFRVGGLGALVLKGRSI